jgi:hypothetical protein
MMIENCRTYKSRHGGFGQSLRVYNWGSLMAPPIDCARATVVKFTTVARARQPLNLER